ncbi:SCO0930 family lipoprotein [Streptomyces blastmyceticus]|uniref:SCO0930 family lipoprotein n=1 Tax=Streptomyces blastmyceticus TaxID=68180 RepID=A0ABP3G5I3_9ACTN
MNKRRQISLAGTAFTVMVLATACDGSPSAKDQGYDTRPAANSSEAGKGYGSGSGSADGYGGGKGADGMGAAGGKLAVRRTADLGQVVTDDKGFTLYRFDKDTAKPPSSHCDGDCAKAWPPVPAGSASASTGIAASALGEVVRADGSRQLTLGGWPVYRYVKDTAPGDTKGQGVGGTWNALAPDGKKASGKTDEGKQPAAPVSVSDSAGLGRILVDGQGRTLYRFNKDSAWPMKFACTDACLDTWKPAKPVDKSKVRDIPGKLVSTVTRPDGTEQLAVDCWPVYWFTGDSKAGDVNGQGKQGLWFAVDDKGKKVTTMPAP